MWKEDVRVKTPSTVHISLKYIKWDMETVQHTSYYLKTVAALLVGTQ